MRRWWLIVLLEGCGRAGLIDGDAGASVTRPDGSADAGADAGTQGLDAGLDAGADGGHWCAQAAGACLADGWVFDAPGRCCLGRMTCKTLDLDAGRPGFCEY